MESGNRESVRRVSALRKAAVVFSSALALTAAACSSPESPTAGATEVPAAAATAGDVPQILGLAGMNLVFVESPAGGHDQIEEENLATGQVVALTPPSCNSDNPQISPDKKRLAYYSDCDGVTDQIFTLSLQDPSDVVRLTHNTSGVHSHDPTYLPDGRILFNKSSPQNAFGNIWITNSDGSAQHVVTPGLIAAHQEGWKPDAVGDKAVFTIRMRQGDPTSDVSAYLDPETGHYDIVKNSAGDWFTVYDASTGKLINITKQDGHDVLKSMNLDGTDKEIIVDMPGDSDDPSLSPDGKWLTFINNGVDGAYSVYVVPATGGTPQLLRKGSNYLAPQLIPAA